VLGKEDGRATTGNHAVKVVPRGLVCRGAAVGEECFAECCCLSTVRLSAKTLFTESLILPGAALGKGLLHRAPDIKPSAKI